MQITGNTMLITGGGSGIGRGLAEAFHKRGNTVIITGRRREVLEQTAAANPGMQFEVFDVADAAAVKPFADRVAARYPALNVLVNMAGIMKTEKVIEVAIAEQTLETNLLGPIRLTAALLPLLEKQPRATIMNVSSGLAFSTLAITPSYCAAKAGLHAWTEALRYQLRRTGVEVVELVPPYVQTELMGSHQASDPNAMPLGEYIDEVMEILATQPGVKEILVRRVYPLRFAGDFNAAKYETFFEQLNESLSR